MSSALIDWSLYPNFSEDEFRCKCGCGQALMDVEFMTRLQTLRSICRFPFFVTSGYRCKDHPAEKRKGHGQTTGEHVLGKAVDINVWGAQARALIGSDWWCWDGGTFPRLGLKQTGPVAGRFIHLGTATEKDGLPSPAVWTY